MSSSSSHPTQFTSPTTDLREKRGRSDSRSRSRSPDARYKSSSVRSHRSPARLYSRQASSTRPSRRSPSLRVRLRSPQFRTPYSPRRKSGDDGHREERSSSRVSIEKGLSRSPNIPERKVQVHHIRCPDRKAHE